MEKIKIRNGNSYWTGTLPQIIKWGKETCYNDLMKRRQKAANDYLSTEEAKAAAYSLVLTALSK